MPDPHLWKWLVQMLENCNTPAYDRNKGRMVRLAEYSRDVMCDLRRETGITYDDRQQGTLQVFRTQKQMDGVAQDIAVLRQYNVPFEELNTAQCVQAEPGLAPSAGKIVGGLRLPGDETGDAFKFSQRLAEMAAAAGVTFLYNTDIRAIRSESGRVSGVETSRGVLNAESYVLALGSFSPLLCGLWGWTCRFTRSRAIPLRRILPMRRVPRFPPLWMKPSKSALPVWATVCALAAPRNWLALAPACVRHGGPRWNIR